MYILRDVSVPPILLYKIYCKFAHIEILVYSNRKVIEVLLDIFEVSYCFFFMLYIPSDSH